MYAAINNRPRYLQVAHWLLAQQQWMTARQVAEVFDVSPKLICDDFAMLRQRKDMFMLDERVQKCRNGHERLIRVVDIHSYKLDGRRYPQPVRCELAISGGMSCGITWRDLVSQPWRRLAHMVL
ncbi:CaiF/GrlA family transcriptional regulator [Aeromonas sp. sif2416]|uniref:CaiF/GrlA family transcriptional regulator n=1 Tax=Aeromonas sp. sif2416 TaxID=2854793 RepID=UPI001C484D57|nr:CaiF/GrlA family transcriptional regulator [Aeromonas sp. sif2416]